MAIVTTSFHSQVYEILRKQILQQKFKMGDQINPKEIAEEHGISVMPVRDALLKLVNQDLVTNKPRIGFFVREFSEIETKNIMELRKMYELNCLTEYFDFINRDELKSIYPKICGAGEITREEFNELDSRLHNTFILASNNEFLINQYNKVRDLFILFQYLDSQRDEETNEEHKKIIESILDGDKQLATDCLKLHLDLVYKSIIDNVRKNRING